MSQQRSVRAVSAETMGRGPTRLISPRRTFHSCGNSSMLVRRMKRPSSGTRGSACSFWRPSPLVSSSRILREILTENFITIGHHGTEFPHLEHPASTTNPRVSEEDRSTRFNLTQDRTTAIKGAIATKIGTASATSVARLTTRAPGKSNVRGTSTANRRETSDVRASRLEGHATSGAKVTRERLGAFL